MARKPSTTIVKPSSVEATTAAHIASAEVGWRVLDMRGTTIAEGRAPTRSAAQAAADRHWTPARVASVRGSYTSDGTYFGPGRGRLLSFREPGKQWVIEFEAR